MLQNPIVILLIFIVFWALNVLSNYFYLKKVNSRIIFYKRRYSGTTNYLSAAVGKINWARKVMMIFVVDNSGTILECDYLYGFTNLSGFKTKQEFIGKKVDDILDNKNEKFLNAIEENVRQLKQQMN